MKALRRTHWAIFATALVFCVGSQADGALELNQVCAETGGCFPGDTAGFPVTIVAPGSYRLTGNLDLSGIAPVTAVQVDSPAVNLDLGGFEIRGSTTCTGTGATISCSPITPLIYGVEYSIASLGSSLRNGTIRGFGAVAVAAEPEGIRISDITAMHNGIDGFDVVRSGLVKNCVAVENQSDGFDADAGSVLQNVIALGNGNHGIEIDGPGGTVSASTSRGNGNRGFNLVAFSRYSVGNVSTANVNPDSCGGGLCTARKRYYLTLTTHQGGTATTACAAGFHMASPFEIMQPATLVYDSQLGTSIGDTGSGPPTQDGGWHRTGTLNETNCLNWTSSDKGEAGATEFFASFPFTNAATVISPLVQGFSEACDDFRRVWCVED